MIGPLRLRSPWLAALGLLAVVVVSLGLVRGTLGVGDAALRLGAAVLALVAVERLVLPLAALLVGQRRTDP
ncbi:MAG: hypothetical protein Q8R60_18670 [Mycobacteriales bacterium]|nr:hypothetical protein [Mycobacteriales bacterium]